ncbi:MAG TPA: thioesterase family protein, partial [Actinomycetota bacterium]|nr:thioesterase family protein [Actinomycetota bacterium]
LGRAVEALDPPEMVVSRVVVEVMKPVPIRPLGIDARVVRPGKRVQLAEAVLRDGDAEVARASVWRIRPAGALDEERNLPPTELPPPLECPEVAGFAMPWRPNYFDAMEWRHAAGNWVEPGPAAVWMRMRVPLIEGEPVSPLTRVLAAADSANGTSWELPLGEFLFINLDLSVHLARMPEGDWVCLDAVSRLGREGIGFTQSRLWDGRGRFGAGAQSLLVSEV